MPLDPALEAAYNVRARRTDFEQIMAKWARQSERFRAGAAAYLECQYDVGPKDRLDLFLCGRTAAPLLIFIHGGYWQRGDKSVFSFVAEPFLDAGVDVAILGYPLCPSVTISGITQQIGKAIAWLWRSACETGISADRFNLCGHSAGGHLTAMMMTIRWQIYADELPGNLLKSAIPVSGLFQLDPLRQTTIADALALDATEAMRMSPHCRVPATSAPVLVSLGGHETSEFHWQADRFIDQWGSHGINVDKHVEPAADHFDMIDCLADRQSAVFNKIRAWLR